MTSIHSIPHNNNLNLYNFLNGQRSNDYTVQEELGFQTTGNIQALLNTDPQTLKNVYEGIIFNPTNNTNGDDDVIGKIYSTKNNWTPQKNTQPKTPMLYCNEQQNSELLPFYPNGEPNTILNPNCKMLLDNTASVTLAGISTFGVTDPSILNNPNNDIGHELNTCGIATEFGSRVLSEGKYSCKDIGAGLNVPSLKTYSNNNGAYYAKPTQMNSNIPLYQTGNWTDEKVFPDNFFAEFNNSVGIGCEKHSPKVIGPGGQLKPPSSHKKMEPQPVNSGGKPLAPFGPGRPKPIGPGGRL